MYACYFPHLLFLVIIDQIDFYLGILTEVVFLVTYVKRLNIPSGVVGACRLDLAYEHFKVLPSCLSNLYLIIYMLMHHCCFGYEVVNCGFIACFERFFY